MFNFSNLTEYEAMLFDYDIMDEVSKHLVD